MNYQVDDKFLDSLHNKLDLSTNGSAIRRTREIY